jgi:hypothetical protein
MATEVLAHIDAWFGNVRATGWLGALVFALAVALA